MSSANLKRPDLIFDADDVTMYFTPTWENEHVAVAYSDRTFGAIDELWEDSCSEVRSPERDVYDVREQDCMKPLTMGFLEKMLHEQRAAQSRFAV